MKPYTCVVRDHGPVEPGHCSWRCEAEVRPAQHGDPGWWDFNAACHQMEVWMTEQIGACWSDQNIKALWLKHGFSYLFRRPQDAVAFKMRWG